MGMSTATRPDRRRPRQHSLACKLTPTVAARIVEHVRSGLFRYNAAALVGVGERALQGWVARGRLNLDEIERAAQLDADGDLPEIDRFGRFVVALEAAEAEAEAKVLGVVEQLATKCEDPATRLRAAIWYLERKAPRTYGRGATRVDLSLNAGTSEDTVIDTVVTAIGQIERRLAGHEAGDDGSAHQ